VPQAQGGPRHRCEGQLPTVQIKPSIINFVPLHICRAGPQQAYAETTLLELIKNPNGTEDSASGRGVRACVARESKLEES
jgi:hypothetical protein